MVVDARSNDLIDEGLPAFHRRWRQVRIERRPVVAVFGVVHLQHAAAKILCLDHVRDRDSFVTTAFVVYIMVVGDVWASRELEYLMATGSHPMAVVGVRPCDGTLLVHLVRDREELLAVFRRVAVEVVVGSKRSSR